jgi:hypothetical protein
MRISDLIGVTDLLKTWYNREYLWKMESAVCWMTLWINSTPPPPPLLDGIMTLPNTQHSLWGAAEGGEAPCNRSQFLLCIIPNQCLSA